MKRDNLNRAQQLIRLIEEKEADLTCLNYSSTHVKIFYYNTDSDVLMKIMPDEDSKLSILTKNYLDSVKQLIKEDIKEHEKELESL